MDAQAADGGSAYAVRPARPGCVGGSTGDGGAGGAGHTVQPALALAGDGDGHRGFQLRTGRACKYFAFDVLFGFLGVVAAPLAACVWGRTGAVNMMYFPPPACRPGTWIFLTVITVLAVANTFVLAEAVLVAAGLRPTSHFDPLSQGVIVLLLGFVPKLGSTFKYGYMQDHRFRTQVLGEASDTQTPRLGVGLDSDQSVDNTRRWVGRRLTDAMAVRELYQSAWRCRIDRDQFAAETLTMTAAAGGLARVPLVNVLREVETAMRPPWYMRGKWTRFLFNLGVSLPTMLIPVFWHYGQVEGRFLLGADWLEIAATLASLLAGTLSFGILFTFFLPITTSLLLRERTSLRRYHDLLLRGRVAPTAANLKAFGLGREVIMEFGKLYWLRASLITATCCVAFFILVALTLIQLLLALLRGTTLVISPYLVVVCVVVVCFSVVFAFVVLEAIKTTRERMVMRTELLRMARRLDDEDAAALCRSIAKELESELESHKVRLLGVPLNSRVLESLLGAIVAVAVVVWQSQQSSS